MSKIANLVLATEEDIMGRLYKISAQMHFYKSNGEGGNTIEDIYALHDEFKELISEAYKNASKDFTWRLNHIEQVFDIRYQRTVDLLHGIMEESGI